MVMVRTMPRSRATWQEKSSSNPFLMIHQDQLNRHISWEESARWGWHGSTSRVPYCENNFTTNKTGPPSTDTSSMCRCEDWGRMGHHLVQWEISPSFGQRLGYCGIWNGLKFEEVISLPWCLYGWYLSNVSIAVRAIFHGKYKGRVLPFATALMSGKRTGHHREVLQVIKREVKTYVGGGRTQLYVTLNSQSSMLLKQNYQRQE